MGIGRNVVVKETLSFSDLVLNLSHVVGDRQSGKTLGTRLSRSTGDTLWARCRVKVETVRARGRGIHTWFAPGDEEFIRGFFGHTQLSLTECHDGTLDATVRWYNPTV